MTRIVPLMIASVALSAPAFAFDGPDREPGERLEKAFEVTDATDEQRLTIRGLFEDTLPEIQAFHEEGRELHERMHDAFRAEVVDRAVVEDIRLDGLDLAERVSSSVLDLMVEAGNVFTRDQRITLMDHHEAMREKRHQLFQHFRDLRSSR